MIVWEIIVNKVPYCLHMICFLLCLFVLLYAPIGNWSMHQNQHVLQIFVFTHYQYYYHLRAWGKKKMRQNKEQQINSNISFVNDSFCFVFLDYRINMFCLYRWITDRRQKLICMLIKNIYIVVWKTLSIMSTIKVSRWHLRFDRTTKNKKNIIIEEI
jgi:hypothetical protein